MTFGRRELGLGTQETRWSQRQLSQQRATRCGQEVRYAAGPWAVLAGRDLHANHQCLDEFTYSLGNRTNIPYLEKSWISKPGTPLRKNRDSEVRPDKGQDRCPLTGGSDPDSAAVGHGLGRMTPEEVETGNGVSAVEALGEMGAGRIKSAYGTELEYKAPS